MKKFAIVDSFGKIVSGDDIKAENELEAHRLIRKANEEKLVELPSLIIIEVGGGLIQDVSIPDSANVVIEVHDFDVDGADEELHTDADNRQYRKSEWV